MGIFTGVQGASVVTQKKYGRTKLTRLSMYSLLILMSASFFLIFWSTIRTAIGVSHPDAGIHERISTERASIRRQVLESTDADHFSAYVSREDASDTDVTRFARLIHRYSSDFYGRPYDLQKQDKIRLLAYIAWNGFRMEDPVNLSSPRMEDTLSLREYILERVSVNEINNPYYNPVIHELMQTIRIYSSELRKELERPFTRDELEEITGYVKNSGAPENELLSTAAASLKLNGSGLDVARYYHRMIGECETELNLRLAIIYTGIGKDYGLRNAKDFFGWFRGGFSGKSLLRKYWVSGKMRSLHTLLRNEYKNYVRYLTEVEGIFDSIDLEEWQLALHNPLPTIPAVKPVGLFGSRRKHDNGTIYKHQGVDLAAGEGTPVYPVQDGFVFFVANQKNGWGNHVEIWHDAHLVSSYSHLRDDAVYRALRRRFEDEGPFAVTRQTRIGSVGRTGNIPENDAQYGYPHLHLEIRKSGEYVNPLVLISEHFRVIPN